MSLDRYPLQPGHSYDFDHPDHGRFRATVEWYGGDHAQVRTIAGTVLEIGVKHCSWEPATGDPPKAATTGKKK